VFDSELESFKTGIDLRAFAASQGYSLDRKESCRGSAVMRHPNGDKIIIKREVDGHHVFFSLRDDTDHGTILDFAKRRLGLSLGAVRKELRPWVGMASSTLPPYPPLPKVVKDRVRVEREFMRMQDAPHHPYLLNERCIAGEVLGSDRFAGTVRIDARGNAVFPHSDADGLSGYELKNHGFTGFASGGSKGLWLSNTKDDDARMVFCESAIDALSHAVLFPDDHARYASIGGKPNPLQPELIRAAATLMPSGSEIISAMDADKAGRELAEVVRNATALTGRTDLRFRIHEPAGVKDWNDVLRGKPKPFSACCRDAPSVV
jgi:Toprim-like/Protein of unknown function (DUF3991)